MPPYCDIGGEVFGCVPQYANGSIVLTIRSKHPSERPNWPAHRGVLFRRSRAHFNRFLIFAPYSIKFKKMRYDFRHSVKIIPFESIHSPRPSEGKIPFFG